MHKVFISYHHSNDQWYKNELVKFGERISVDRSVDTGNIPDQWTDEQIRQEIRDRYLRDSTVTIVLVGTETKQRKHVDWEIYSSMYDGSVNKQSGIVVINLPGVSENGSSQRSVQFWSVSMANKSSIVSDLHGWRTPSVSGEELQAPGKSGPQ